MKKRILSLIFVIAMLCTLTSHASTETREFVLPPSATPAPDWVLIWEDYHRINEYHTEGRFRPIFYRICGFLADLVDRELVDAWQLSRMGTAYYHITEEYFNEAAVVSFIRHFNISREDFERANEELRQFAYSLGYPLNSTSIAELYPVDLIFTFDNELINAYFLWENSRFAPEVGLPLPEVCLVELWGEPHRDPLPPETEPPETDEHVPDTTPATEAETEPTATEPPTEDEDGLALWIVLAGVGLLVVVGVVVVFVVRKKKGKE